MFTIIVPDLKKEYYDDIKEEFININIKGGSFTIQHSLISVSKWESKWNKPFLDDDDKSNEEMLDYIKCMTITQKVRSELYDVLTAENFKDVGDYINAPMTATTFSGSSKENSKEIVTSELIYYWMVALNIPFECQKWHLNRLITLIKICNIKNQPNEKQSRQSILKRNRALNESRKQKLNTKG